MRKPKLTYANVMSTLAVFMAMGGVSYAAIVIPNNSVGTAQIKDKNVTNADLADKAVTSAKIDPAVISLFKGQTGPAGARGDAGIPGPKGDTGPPGAPGSLSGMKLVNALVHFSYGRGDGMDRYGYPLWVPTVISATIGGANILRTDLIVTDGGYAAVRQLTLNQDAANCASIDTHNQYQLEGPKWSGLSADPTYSDHFGVSDTGALAIMLPSRGQVDRPSDSQMFVASLCVASS